MYEAALPFCFMVPLSYQSSAFATFHGSLHLPSQHRKSSPVNASDHASKVDASMVLHSLKIVQARFWLYLVGSTSKP